MAGEGKDITKSYFDVLGICCPSEVPLIENILRPLEGVQKVSVIVPSKTVIVLHEPSKISQLQIERALNAARLEASVRAYGVGKIAIKWPSPWIAACGILLIVSLFQSFFGPLKWLALAAAAVGLPQILLRSVAALRRLTLDINILMLIAVCGAVALRDFSEAGFIVFLFTMAEWLESMASYKATSGMSLLMSLAPQKAVVAETGETVDVKDVKLNTIIAVKAGEVIPIDGIVVEGSSEVDQKSLTGESFPVAKQPDSSVFAGTLNINGYISVKTTALAEHSAVANMARLVEEAQTRRSKTQRIIDSCAKFYTPSVVVIAAGVSLTPYVLRLRNKTDWLELGLVLLVSACPCALVLSTPVATFCALLRAARTGLLVKGGDVLETLANAKVVAFDKTGTITRGEFSVKQLRPLSSEVAFNTLLFWISSLESKSSHPMASALVDYARINSIDPKPEDVKDFEIYPGEGVSGMISGKKIYIGNKRIATRAGCKAAPGGEYLKDASTLGFVFLDSLPIGIFALSDTCRSGAKAGIEELKLMGIKTAMLTGDSTVAAMQAHEQLGQIIEQVHAELLPEDKVQIISDLKATNGTTIMVGDGMNDAPALAAADVGISMGVSGSAAAMETSHITLMSNDIRKIAKAVRIARRTHLKIITNIFFSLITKAAILGLAISGHPLLWAAVLADVGTCLLVILNSMTLLGATNKMKRKKCCHGSSEGKECNDTSNVCCKSLKDEHLTVKIDSRHSHSDKHKHSLCEKTNSESCCKSNMEHKHSHCEKISCESCSKGKMKECNINSENCCKSNMEHKHSHCEKTNTESCCKSNMEHKHSHIEHKHSHIEHKHSHCEKRNSETCCKNKAKECNMNNKCSKPCCGKKIMQMPEIIVV